MISMPSRSTTGPRRGEIQRHDRDFLALDVEPDVELGPVRQREHAHALAAALAAVVEPPGLRRAGASDPSGDARCGAKKCAPWRATSPRRAARRRTRHRSRIWSSAWRSACVFITSVWTSEPWRDRTDAARERRPDWCARSGRGRARCARAVAERDHLAELPGRVDVQQRERRLGRDRTPSAPDAAAPTSPCRSSRA